MPARPRFKQTFSLKSESGLSMQRWVLAWGGKEYCFYSNPYTCLGAIYCGNLSIKFKQISEHI
jgi:hypothetical protein